ncbi:biotin/lipoyl-binding protein [Aerococcus sanguinicola]|uniref:biotin/lipoyl-binding protein n=1 Tax=unclassified Aerococcus TaxID=2618060 RepID=UPI0008A38E0E|nr:MULTISPECIES: biotin/lipoyl-binding protein [unclassified Aerococcus]KAB0646226.1 biotin/lipoyl-binding protein [Aerococcus sanguinicola]MDK6234084.1 biotin/lipoyl-binding protein [Aerococcus sp. UMB10185]MDK6856266.1 biotin/lipoyl-binding protein [Aerococcus sp. UMB7533]MDK8503118.1 biotin/lipoyl-binding protein [Aerococcus sp. UMB1112A]OFN01091.1 hypothetical protein HMPREF2626_02885 [Aerococcus sp. HMSC062A02]
MIHSKKLWWGLAGGLAAVLVLGVLAYNVFYAANFGEEGSDTSYETVKVTEQEPVTVDGKAKLKTDDAYYYSREKGDLGIVNVADGQRVNKGDVLFSYQQAEAQYKIDDTKRQLNRLYDQRNRLQNQAASPVASVNQALVASPLVSGLGAYVATPVNLSGAGVSEGQAPAASDPNCPPAVSGQAGQAAIPGAGSDQAVASPGLAGQAGPEAGETVPSGLETGGQAGGMGDLPAAGGQAGVDEQVRQLNQQIEDLEIQLNRAQAQTDNQVKARTSGKVIYDAKGITDSTVPLVRIISDDISVTGTVGEYDFYLLKDGRKVDLTVPASGQKTTGEIISYENLPAAPGEAPSLGGDAGAAMAGQAAQAAGQGGESQYPFTVKAKDKIQPGFSTKVHFKLPGFVLPKEAIIEDKGKSYVFVYRDGKVKKVEVTTAKQGRQEVVTKNIKAGDEIIKNPEGLQDGQEIELAESADKAEAESKN